MATMLALLISISITDKVIAQEVDKVIKTQQPENKSVVENDSIYRVLEQMPVYPGGDKARIKFLTDNIKYPKEAQKKGIQGRVFISYVVEKDGKLTNFKLLRGIGGGCDEEALRVVSLFPNYEPGRDEDGNAVRTLFNIPIHFRLDNDSKEKNKDKTNAGPPPPYKK
jgi:protein TonB